MHISTDLQHVNIQAYWTSYKKRKCS